ncbi:exocyst complex component 2-like isoform X2 [Anneissia japonica]|uniref:exocyst complex component 2-like isoform X2 n=1 Tax=Anneissia japonica TaxID=1529436 RepID=UPI0014258429|nr:exocyst complex component 2-like isoform X2 [Anneissia japonica]
MANKKGKVPPKVTGLSPNQGPPGTKVTIRGENLGNSSKDLVGLYICNANVLLSAEWHSPSKIVCRTTNCKGNGDVIVATKSGGVGTSTVKFRGLNIIPGPLQEVAIWVDEPMQFEKRIGTVNRPSSPLHVGNRDDPLGLSVESPLQFTDEELQKMFPGGSGNFALKTFEPVWFLIENHNATSFDDLKAGLVHLRKQSANQKTEGPQSFIKTNLGTFMNCQDILTTIHSSLMEDEVTEDPDTKAPAALLESLLVECDESAQKIFRKILRNKALADSTRNALNVLNRFKFLFHLPINIERNIQSGEYEVVINDYAKAKSLFATTTVTVFKQIYEEVENKIVQFREQLRKRLMELPSTMDEQKKLIKHLVELEAPGDPAWDCISNQQIWLMSLLHTCKDNHLQMGECSITAEQTNTQMIRIVNDSRQRPDGKFSLPRKVLFLEELLEILQETFPDFCKLGQAYFNGNIIIETSGKPMKIDTDKAPVFKEMSVDQGLSEQLNTFDKMVSEILKLLSNLVRAAFLPESLSKLPKHEQDKYGMWNEVTHESASAWLPQCVRKLRSIVTTLSSLDVPSAALENLNDLITDLRVHCMVKLFEEAADEVHALSSRETWQLQVDDSGGITSLPLLFESVIMETLQHLHEVVNCAWKGETDIFMDYDVQQKAVALCVQSLNAFSTTLDKLAFEGDNGDDSRVKSDSNNYSQSVFFTEDTQPSVEQCLVIMLSNCSYVSQNIIHQLKEQFDKHGYPKSQEVENNALESYAELDEKIFEAYCEQKIEPLIGALEQGMYAGNMDWNDCPRPTGVRNYVKEAVMKSIAIHAEIHAIAPAFLMRVMTEVFTALAEELSRLMSCIPKFSQNGALQARLELSALHNSLSPYRNAATSGSFTEAISVIPDLRNEKDKIYLSELLNRYKSEMQFQMMCFTDDS